MEKMSDLQSSRLVEAIVLWTGWGRVVMPIRDDLAVRNRFGDEEAGKLLLIIKSLENDFYSSDARLVAANLVEMAKLAEAHFRNMHPAVADEITRAFSWCYTFDFK